MVNNNLSKHFNGTIKGSGKILDQSEGVITAYGLAAHSRDKHVGVDYQQLENRGIPMASSFVDLKSQNKCLARILQQKKPEIMNAFCGNRKMQHRLEADFQKTERNQETIKYLQHLLTRNPDPQTKAKYLAKIREIKENGQKSPRIFAEQNIDSSSNVKSNIFSRQNGEVIQGKKDIRKVKAGFEYNPRDPRRPIVITTYPSDYY